MYWFTHTASLNKPRQLSASHFSQPFD
jgi:hypothetical protein